MTKAPKKPAAGAESSGLLEVPYEKVLLKAFDKLSSEVLVFLLACMVLVVVVAKLVPSLPAMLGSLFYILPVLGVFAYVWSKRASLIKGAQDRGVSLYTGVTTGSARVTGLRGKVAGWLGRIKVWSLFAADDARVTAVEVGTAEQEPPAEQYMLQLFRQLDEAGRAKLVNRATQLLAAGGRE